MQRTLDAFLRFYAEQRLHQGYRRGARPRPKLFWGVAAGSAVVR